MRLIASLAFRTLSRKKTPRFHATYRRPERVAVKGPALERPLLARGVADGLEDPASADVRLFFGIVFVSCCRGGGRKRRRRGIQRRSSSSRGNTSAASTRARNCLSVLAERMQSVAPVARRVGAGSRGGRVERRRPERSAAGLLHRGAGAAVMGRRIFRRVRSASWCCRSRRRSQRTRDER